MEEINRIRRLGPHDAGHCAERSVEDSELLFLQPVSGLLLLQPVSERLARAYAKELNSSLNKVQDDLQLLREAYIQPGASKRHKRRLQKDIDHTHGQQEKLLRDSVALRKQAPAAFERQTDAGKKALLAMHAEIEACNVDIEKDWRKFQDEVISSPWSNFGWNLVAGATAYGVSFGVATAMARPLATMVHPMAGVLLLMAAPLHTALAEPIAARIRAVTYGNPSSKITAENHRLWARKAGDWVRAQAGLDLKKTYSAGEKKNLSAAEALEAQGGATGAAHMLKASLTDDAPFLSFTALYSAKNAIEYHGGGLLALPEGRLIDMAVQMSAGALAGAATLSIGQQMRKSFFHGEVDLQDRKNLPAVTKTAAIWAKEAARLHQLLETLSQQRDQAQPTATGAELSVLNGLIDRVQARWREAHTRSQRLSSVALDVRKVFQPKKPAQRDEPELPGNRLESTCAILGKAASLATTVAVGAHFQLAKMGGAAQTASTIALSRFLPPLFLIANPGWMMRGTYSLVLRVAAGAAKGVRDVLDPEEYNADVEAAYARQAVPALSSVVVDDWIDDEGEPPAPSEGTASGGSTGSDLLLPEEREN